MPPQVQAQARLAYQLFRQDPFHPSLWFKQVHATRPIFSARVGLAYRALAMRHVDHLWYGLELMNRWGKGESPFADADYAASWRRVTVSAEEWRELRRRLRAEIEQWSAAIQQPRDLTEADLTGVVASVVHMAYHVGAIRQMDRSIRGPKARD